MGSIKNEATGNAPESRRGPVVEDSSAPSSPEGFPEPENIIFTCVFGEDEHYECATEMILSLRATGYGGRVIVLADHAYDFGGGAEIRIVAEPSYSPYKMLLHKYADLGGVGKILFVDSDIYFSHSPRSLFDACDNSLIIARENITVGRNPHNIQGFSEEQRLDPGLMGHPSVNSGSIVFPSPAHYIACAEKWTEAWHAVGLIWDQPALQLLLSTAQLRFDYIPPSLFSLPLLWFEERPLAEGMVFLHLCGFPRNPGKTGRGRVLLGMRSLARCTGLQEQLAVIHEMRRECNARHCRGE